MREASDAADGSEAGRSFGEGQDGRQRPPQVEKLRRLREELDKGARSLDAGKGMRLSVEEFIRQKTTGHGHGHRTDQDTPQGEGLDALVAAVEVWEAGHCAGGWMRPLRA